MNQVNIRLEETRLKIAPSSSTPPGKLLFYLKVKRVFEEDYDERYFRDCQDENYTLFESKEEDF